MTIFSKKLFVVLLFCFFLSFLAGCAGFLDDYQYRPMGVSQPSY